MLEQDRTEIRKERHKITQEDFTPDCIIDRLLKGSEELFTDFSKIFCDPCAGIGNILLYILRKRFENCQTQSDCEQAVSTCYGTELMSDNTEECKERIYNLVQEFNFEVSNKIKEIVEHNIVCTVTFEWNYNVWAKACNGLF